MTTDSPGVDAIVAYYRAVAQSDIGALEAVVVPTCEIYNGGHMMPWPAFTGMLAAFSEGFSGITITIDQIVECDTAIAVRTTTHGLHTGMFLGHDPTLRAFACAGTDFFVVVDGRITEVRSLFDTIGMLQQLGLYVQPVGEALS
jgi:predicted ester cyclase